MSPIQTYITTVGINPCTNKLLYLCHFNTLKWQEAVGLMQVQQRNYLAFSTC